MINMKRLEDEEIMVIGTIVPNIKSWVVYANKEKEKISFSKCPILLYSVKKFSVTNETTGDYKEEVMCTPVCAEETCLTENECSNIIGIELEGEQDRTEEWLDNATEYFKNQDRRNKKMINITR